MSLAAQLHHVHPVAAHLVKERGRGEGERERGRECLLHIQCTAHVHVKSAMETRQCNATTPEKGAASGRTQTCNILHTMYMLYQLSYRGSSAEQAKSLKSIEGQGISPLTNRVTLTQY